MKALPYFQSVSKGKALEIPSRMSCAVPKEVRIESDLEDILAIETEEDVNGTRPKLTIRIKRILRKS